MLSLKKNKQTKKTKKQQKTICIIVMQQRCSGMTTLAGHENPPSLSDCGSYTWAKKIYKKFFQVGCPFLVENWRMHAHGLQKLMTL